MQFGFGKESPFSKVKIEEEGSDPDFAKKEKKTPITDENAKEMIDGVIKISKKKMNSSWLKKIFVILLIISQK